MGAVRKWLLCKVALQKLILFLYPASYAPYNSWQERCRTSSHMENLERSLGFRKHPSPCPNIVSSFATWRLTRIVVPVHFDGRCHVTFSWFSCETSFHEVAWLREMTALPLSRTLMSNVKRHTFLCNWCRLARVVPQYCEFVRLSHAYITRSYIHCPGNAEECEKPHGPPLNQQLGYVSHTYMSQVSYGITRICRIGFPRIPHGSLRSSVNLLRNHHRLYV